MSRRSGLRLADLLEVRELGLELVTTDTLQLERPVRGAHSIEVERPAPWLDRDSLMLTSGMALQNDERAQRELVADLAEAGIAALAFGVGPYFDEVPDTIIEDADRLSFPVVRVPWATKFFDVEQVVHRSLLDSDLDAYRRLTAMQSHLLDSFSDEQPLETVIQRLAGLVEAPVAILGPSGRVQHSTGAGPWREAWGEVTKRPVTLLEFEVQRRQVIAAPVLAVTGRPNRWIVIARRRRPSFDALAKAIVQVTAPLVAAMSRLSEAEKRQERIARSLLLEAILDLVDGQDNPGFDRQLELFGFDREAEARVFAIRLHAETPERRAELRTDLQAELETDETPYLLCDVGGVLLVLVEGLLEEIEQLPALSRDSRSRVMVGSGRAIRGIADIPRSARDAKFILDRMDPSEQRSSFDSLDLGEFLMTSVERERVDPKVREILARLDERPGVREAVEAYLEHDLNIGGAALALRLHPNSVRYRLKRAEESLGRSLQSPSTIIAVSLALSLDEK